MGRNTAIIAKTRNDVSTKTRRTWNPYVTLVGIKVKFVSSVHAALFFAEGFIFTLYLFVCVCPMCQGPEEAEEASDPRAAVTVVMRYLTGALGLNSGPLEVQQVLIGVQIIQAPIKHELI